MRRTFFHPINAIQWLTLFIAAGLLIISPFVVLKLNHEAVATQKLTKELAAVDCRAKHDAKVQLNSAIKFLDEHPNGTPDFSRKFILQSIRQDRQRAKNLAGITCEGVPK